MDNIIVCDSGLGGLDIAGHFFLNKAEAPEWNLIYYNAYPSATYGFNDLPTPQAQEDLLMQDLMQMEAYHPKYCLIACNTLSIIWQRLSLRYAPSFPVIGIIQTAVDMMADFLTRNVEAELLILGTKSTIASQVYPLALQARGIAAERCHSLACPRLATLIEQAPLAEAVQQRIQYYAQEAKNLFSVQPRHLVLSFCCTHFGYATNYWKQAFSRQFAQISILNPNENMVMPGCGTGFQYISKFPLAPQQKEAISSFFEQAGQSIIAKALI